MMLSVARVLRLTALLAAASATSVTAYAAPILLAHTYGGSFGSGGPGFATEMSFRIQYADLGGFPVEDVCIGCDVYVPLGFTGELDFDAANSSGFISVRDRVTNGVSELLFTGVRITTTTAFTGGAGGNTEGSYFRIGRQTDLVGREIDFVRVAIFRNDVVRNTLQGHNLEYLYRWEFWGKGEPLPMPVPAPSILAVSGLAIGLKLLRRRRTREGVGSKAGTTRFND